MDISIGRTVHYILSEQDALEINRRRTNGKSISERLRWGTAGRQSEVIPATSEDGSIRAWPSGAQAHIGSETSSGQVYPAVAVRVWSAGCANFQVFLDGNDTYWATSRNEGTLPDQWQWPPSV